MTETQTSVLAPGIPSWVDLSTPDVESAKRFYGELFGWKADEMPDPEAGGYAMFKLDGKEVCGVGPLMDPNMPPAWTTYVLVKSAAETTEKAVKAGATVLMAPMVVMKAGTMAILQDPTGAVIALWEAGEHVGAEIFNSPGAVGWNELSTRDPRAASKFYNEIFGWGAKVQGEGADQYTEFQVDDRSIAGMMDITGRMPDAVPANWLTYFVVTDCQATADRAKELGGDLRMGPLPTPMGPFAVLADPQGAVFAVIQPQG